MSGPKVPHPPRFTNQIKKIAYKQIVATKQNLEEDPFLVLTKY